MQQPRHQAAEHYERRAVVKDQARLHHDRRDRGPNSGSIRCDEISHVDGSTVESTI